MADNSKRKPAPRSKRIISVYAHADGIVSISKLKEGDTDVVAPPSLKKRTDPPHAIALLRLRLNRPAGARSNSREEISPSHE